MSDFNPDAMGKAIRIAAGADPMPDPRDLRIAELEAPYRNADAKDWEWLENNLGHGGHGQFWRAVMSEVRAALTKPNS